MLLEYLRQQGSRIQYYLMFFSLVFIVCYIQLDKENPAYVIFVGKDRHQTSYQFKRDIAHNWRNLTSEEINNLSVLGRRLYLQEDIGVPKNKNFTILFWETGRSTISHLIRLYGKVNKDPFQNCSVKNCKIEYDNKYAATADAILIQLYKISGPVNFPKRANYDQKWIWLTDESPPNTFTLSRDRNISHYNGYFNWSMSYKMDSDVPVPYGRTLVKSDAEISSYKSEDFFAQKTKLVAILTSHCHVRNQRLAYVKLLQESIPVDVYGRCGPLKCPGHMVQDCIALNDYLFYLAFENSDCEEYITEKPFMHSLRKGSVPVVMGPDKHSYSKIVPPNSFIHVDDFKSPSSLAQYLLKVSKDRDLYMKYHEWRSTFKIVNEHGFFGSDVFHYCRLCEALNYNDLTPKVYNHMEVFWGTNVLCRPLLWKDRMKEA